MKRAAALLTLAILITGLCACSMVPVKKSQSPKPSVAAATKTPVKTPRKTATSTPEPTVSLDMSDPMSQYTVLAKKNDKKQIAALLESLLAAGDYKTAGEIVNKEYKAGRSDPYDTLCSMFKGHEAAVDMVVWADRYRQAAKNKSQKELEPQLALMRSFHDILYKHFDNGTDAMSLVYGGLTYAFKDDKGALLAICGKKAKGKALVYTKSGTDYAIDMSLTAALPEKLLPLTLDEAEYIILLETKRVTVGRYSNGGAAQRQDLTISLLRYPKGETINTYGTLKGGSPPTVISVIKGSTMGATGAKPTKDKVIPLLTNALSDIKKH